MVLHRLINVANEDDRFHGIAIHTHTHTFTISTITSCKLFAIQKTIHLLQFKSIDMISQNKDSFIYIVSSSNRIWTVNRCAFWLNRYYKHSKSRFATIVIQLFRAIETFVAVPNTKTWLLSRRTMRFSISHFFRVKYQIRAEYSIC